jgi:DNA-binding CsgD family transcriptional regulator
MGDGRGKPCWDVVPRSGCEDLSCRRGCVGQLVTRGLEQSQHARVRGEGRGHALTCVPLGDSVVCMLGIDAAESPESWELITPRERDVLQLLADGETTGAIARRLELSESTIRTHVEHMLAKLGASTRAQLVSLGYRFGFLS